MPTRNFYEIPDVSATLLTAIANHNTKLIAATVKELMESGCNPVPLLILGWALSPPIPQFSKACYLAYLSGTTANLVEAVQQLPAYTLPPLPDEPPSPPASKHTNYLSTWPLPIGWTLLAKARFEQAVAYALKTKNFRHAAYLTSALTTKETIQLLHHLGIEDKYTNLFETTEFKPLHTRLIEHAYAILAFKDEPVVKKQLPATSQGRCFSIPMSAYSVWNVQPKSPKRLLGLPIHIMEKDASPFWKSQIERFKITCKDNEFHFPDDVLQEEFYIQNFPNDIPDEWSNEERLKSHPFPTVLNEPNGWLPVFNWLIPS
jgi:hypothetical protein